MLREVKEETSLEIKESESRLILEGDHVEGDKEINYQIYGIGFYNGEIKLGEDHTDFGWFEKGQIGDLDVTPFVKDYFLNQKV